MDCNRRCNHQWWWYYFHRYSYNSERELPRRMDKRNTERLWFNELRIQWSDKDDHYHQYACSSRCDHWSGISLSERNIYFLNCSCSRCNSIQLEHKRSGCCNRSWYYFEEHYLPCSNSSGFNGERNCNRFLR